ncbi:MAG: polysaccharide deacetylase family protein, partial [Bacteroidales bacterium]|nr:polysaccharide deacetylase family protein [Bacteroidales bacterium]
MWPKSSYLLGKIYPSAIWKIPVDKKTVFLSFDDGPHPEITPRVLDLLDSHNAQASFFCVGKNVEKYPGIYSEILKRGHVTGNHTFSHLNGWKTINKDYFEDIKKASQLIDSNLFRPPYGRIKTSQLWKLKKDYKIIMWDVLSMD